MRRSVRRARDSLRFSTIPTIANHIADTRASIDPLSRVRHRDGCCWCVADRKRHLDASAHPGPDHNAVRRGWRLRILIRYEWAISIRIFNCSRRLPGSGHRQGRRTLGGVEADHWTTVQLLPWGTRDVVRNVRLRPVRTMAPGQSMSLAVEPDSSLRGIRSGIPGTSRRSIHSKRSSLFPCRRTEY
jgi:hypothetical protein